MTCEPAHWKITGVGLTNYSHENDTCNDYHSYVPGETWGLIKIMIKYRPFQIAGAFFNLSIHLSWLVAC